MTEAAQFQTQHALFENTVQDLFAYVTRRAATHPKFVEAVNNLITRIASDRYKYIIENEFSIQLFALIPSNAIMFDGFFFDLIEYSIQFDTYSEELCILYDILRQQNDTLPHNEYIDAILKESPS